MQHEAEKQVQHAVLYMSQCPMFFPFSFCRVPVDFVTKQLDHAAQREIYKFINYY